MFGKKGVKKPVPTREEEDAAVRGRRSFLAGAAVAGTVVATGGMSVVASGAAVSTPAAAGLATKTLFGTSALESIAGLGVGGGKPIAGLTSQMANAARSGKKIRDAFHVCQQFSGSVNDALGTYAANGGELAELGITPRDLFSPNIDDAIRASGTLVDERMELLNQARATLRQFGASDAADWTGLKSDFTRMLAEQDHALRELLPRCSDEEKRLIWNHIDPLHTERDDLARLALEKAGKKSAQDGESDAERLARKPADDTRSGPQDEDPRSRMYWTVVQLSEIDEVPARFQLFSPYGEIAEDDAKRFVFDLSLNKQRGAQTRCQYRAGGIVVQVNDPSAATTMRAIASNNIGQSPEERYGVPAGEIAR